jgi:hypothetical protein
VTTTATPRDELEDTEEEVIERAAVEPLVGDAEFLIPDELEDWPRVDAAEEPDPESEEVGLALTVSPVNPTVAELLVDVIVDICIRLDTGIVVATETE